MTGLNEHENLRDRLRSGRQPVRRASGALPEVEVCAYDVWKDHTAPSAQHGLRLSGAADFTARLNATSDPQDSALRLRHRGDQGDPHRAAIAQAAHIFDDNSAVCSVQNGVGNEEIIAEHVKHVIRGTTFPAGHPDRARPRRLSTSRATPGSARSSRPRRP